VGPAAGCLGSTEPGPAGSACPGSVHHADDVGTWTDLYQR